MDNILAKIKKLQALATNNSNVAEAAAAAAKAQALMFEHNITAAEVDTAVAPETYEKIEHTLDANRNTIGWKASLLYVIARNNFCRAVGHGGTTRMSLVGKRSNVEGVLYLYAICEREIERLATAETKAQLVDKAVFKRSFCRGAVATIGERLKAQRQANETQANTAQTTALVLRNVELEVATQLKKFFPRLTQRRSSARVHGDGYARGQAAGRTIGLYGGIGRQAAGYLQ